MGTYLTAFEITNEKLEKLKKYFVLYNQFHKEIVDRRMNKIIEKIIDMLIKASEEIQLKQIRLEREDKEYKFLDKFQDFLFFIMFTLDKFDNYRLFRNEKQKFKLDNLLFNILKSKEFNNFKVTEESIDFVNYCITENFKKVSGYDNIHGYYLIMDWDLVDLKFQAFKKNLKNTILTYHYTAFQEIIDYALKSNNKIILLIG